MTVLVAAAVAGVTAAGGGWLALAGWRPRAVGRLGAVLGPWSLPLPVGLLALSAVAVPSVAAVVAPLVAGAVGWGAVTAMVGRLEAGALDTLDLLGLPGRDRRAALGRDVAGRASELAARMPAGVIGAVLLTGSGSGVRLTGAILAAAAVAGRLPPVRPPASSAPVPARPLTVVEGPDRATSFTGPGVVAVATEPHHYRAAVGWNLGLGLNAEQAAWAAQLARRLDGGSLLTQRNAPAARDARALAVCRALASDAGIIVLDRPFEGMTKREARRLAELVAGNAAGRRIVVVVDRRTDASPIEAAFDGRGGR